MSGTTYNRRAYVDPLTPIFNNGVVVRPMDSDARLAVPLAHPHIGGASTGFHSAPKRTDQAALISEIYGKPVGIVSTNDNPASLPPLAEGESGIYAPDGSRFLYLPATGGAQIASTDLQINAQITTRVNTTPTITYINLATPTVRHGSLCTYISGSIPSVPYHNGEYPLCVITLPFTPPLSPFPVVGIGNLKDTAGNIYLAQYYALPNPSVGSTAYTVLLCVWYTGSAASTPTTWQVSSLSALCLYMGI